LAANRNGGMLRLIASRHDDDDDEPLSAAAVSCVTSDVCLLLSFPVSHAPRWLAGWLAPVLL